MHLGVRPQDITIIDLNRPPEGLEWQYKSINFMTRHELDARLESNLDYIKEQDYSFAVVATSPSAHGVCAKEAIKNGLPVMIEKPMFSSTKQYDEFVKYCDEQGGHVYAIDWQRSLSTPLYTTLGQDMPFADSIEYDNREAFSTLASDAVVSLMAIFNEGRGNPLADIRHRRHLLKNLSEEGGWACGGMLADMGIHPIHSVTGAGFRLERITDAFFGGSSDDHGYRPEIQRRRDAKDGNEPEMYARVHARMSLNGQKNIPVTFECGKGPAPNMNDMRTMFELASGRLLVNEFGHRVNRVTLYSNNDMKAVLTRATDRGEPYERMFLEASELFDKWKKTAKGEARIAHGDACREALRVVEEAHRYACDTSFQGRKMRQIALEQGWGDVQDVGEKAGDFIVVTIEEGQFKIISPEEVLKDSCQWHANAEGAVFDAVSGCFYYVDNELGLLARYNPATEEHKTWRLVSPELDVDGRPKQMLSVARVNHDGSVVVMLSQGGENAGLNYFDPNTGELRNVGKIPGWEQQHPDNRPNDETILNIKGKNLICYGTMDRNWDKKFDTDSKFERAAAYYLLDPATLESRQLTFEDGVFSGTIITNGLADGGDAGHGKRFLFWAETVEDTGKTGETLNVYRGVLDPESYKVSNIEVFKNHRELGGIMNGTDAYGRPDGAKIALYKGKEVYGVSMLQLGQIRFFYSNPGDVNLYKKEALRIQLPKGMTKNTQFALGTDGNGAHIGVVTTQDSGYFTRRWQANAERSKAKDGLNGTVIKFDLPEGLKAHPQTTKRVDYPALCDLPGPSPARALALS